MNAHDFPIPDLLDEAIDAFFTTVAREFPGASGDFPPDADARFRDAAAAAIDTWVQCNVDIDHAEPVPTPTHGFQVGDRVILTRDADRYPDFVADAGTTGTIVYAGPDGTTNVRADDPIPGAEEWGNEIMFAFHPTGEDDPKGLQLISRVIAETTTSPALLDRRAGRAVDLAVRYHNLEIVFRSTDRNDPYAAAVARRLRDAALVEAQVADAYARR